MKIEELHFSVRTYNCLKRKRIDTVEQLQEMTDDQLMKIRGFGMGCLAEVRRLITRGPAIPSPADSDYNMAELCFRNGEENMKEKVIAMRMESKMFAKGMCHECTAAIIQKIEKL